MPNIKISDLEPAALPLDGSATFFEAQTVEAGEDVSRKVSLDDIVSTTGLDASFLTVSANAQLPNERVLTAGTAISFVDTGPNGTLTINVTGGFGDVFKVGTPVDDQIGVWTGDGTIEGDPNFTFDGSQLLVPQANVPGAPTIGFGDGDSGFFEGIDDNLQVSLVGVSRFFWELDSFNAVTGTGPAMRNEAVSATNPVFVPRRSDPDSGIGQNANNEVSLIGGGVELARAVAAASGGLLANNTLTGAGIERVLTVSDLGGFGDVFKVGTPVDNQIGVWTGDGTIEGDANLTWDGGTKTLNLGAGGSIFAGSSLYSFQDGNLSLDGESTIIPVFSIIQGGINNQAVSLRPTAMVFNHDAGGLVFNISGNLARWEFETALRVTNSTGSDWIEQDHDGVDYNFTAFQTADINFTGLTGRIKQGAETLAFVSEITVPDPLQLSSGGAGVPTYSFSVDTDTGVYNPALDILGLTAGGVLGLSLTESGSHVVQTNEEHVGLTASVTQTQAGGLALLSSYNEIATVGTTGDALTAFAVAVGNRLVVINNGANDLQLFPAVGDDFGAGVDTAITIAAGELGIFIGRDLINWDTLYNAAPTGGGAGLVAGTVDGQVTIWDIANNQYEPVPSSSLLINPLAPPTSPRGRISGGGSSTTDVRTAFIHINIGASVSTVWSTDDNGGTPSGFYSRSSMNSSPQIHDWGYWDPGNQTGLTIFSMTEDLEFIHEQSAFFEERAAALASVAARGQVWVRNDVPNVLVYTDDTGADFVLNAVSPGGGLPAGTVANAALKWDGISAWVEDTQFAFVGGATGFQVRDATLADFIGLNHNGTTAGVSVNGATTEVIFGQGGGPTTFWTFNEQVRVPNGSAAAPGLVFFTGGTDGFFRNAFPGVSVSVGGTEQMRITNADTEVYSDEFILAPNIGTDRVTFSVSPPSDTNDLRVLLTSLVDVHWRGTGGERFVLEEYNLAMFEKSAAPGDVAGTGQFWVRDDVPNIPMYTDDAGTDKKLGLVNDAVQARRTTTQTLTVAFVDVTLDVTDVETDAAVLDHDLVTNTDNIIIGETGTYEISYQFNIATITAANSLIDVSGRVRLNDAGTGIPGSLATGNCKRQHGNDIASHMSVKFIVDLTAADFVTLQVQKSDLAATEAFFIDETTLQVTRLL